MINTPYVADCISDRDKTNLIRDAIAAGISQYGTQTFDQSVYSLYEKELISYEQGLRYSTSPDNFKLRVKGITTSAELALEDMERDLNAAAKRENHSE
jgi:twitching motility protein PilT